MPAGFAQQDVQNALDKVRLDTTGTCGVYLPAGDYQTTGKFQVYGKAVKVVGAGAWYTQFVAPATMSRQYLVQSNYIVLLGVPQVSTPVASAVSAEFSHCRIRPALRTAHATAS